MISVPVACVLERARVCAHACAPALCGSGWPWNRGGVGAPPTAPHLPSGREAAGSCVAQRIFVARLQGGQVQCNASRSAGWKGRAEGQAPSAGQVGTGGMRVKWKGGRGVSTGGGQGAGGGGGRAGGGWSPKQRIAAADGGQSIKGGRGQERAPSAVSKKNLNANAHDSTKRNGMVSLQLLYPPPHGARLAITSGRLACKAAAAASLAGVGGGGAAPMHVPQATPRFTA